jgi:hypothetical protein
LVIDEIISIQRSGGIMKAIRVLPLVSVLVVAAPWLVPLDAEAQVTCGAKLTADTTLTPSDPIVFAPGDTPCPRGGLQIAAPLTLDCSGLTIKGSGRDTGIKILPTVEGAVITNCVVEAFGTGVALGGKGSHAVDRTTVVSNAGVGMSVASDSNVLSGVVADANGGVGIQIKGSGNVLDSSLALENGKAGISLMGKEHSVTGSVGIRNGAEGLVGTARQSSIGGNTLVDNKGTGLKFRGGTVAMPNDFSFNKAITNEGDGIVVHSVKPEANFDSGGNFGFGNDGKIQCQIGTTPCQ